jgi:hypothetical protein
VTLPDPYAADDCIIQRPYVEGAVGDLRVQFDTPSQLTTEVGGDETKRSSISGLVLRSNAY